MALVPETGDLDAAEPPMFQADTMGGMYYSPRRSMPEIKASNPHLLSQMKRNSYQEESKFNVGDLCSGEGRGKKANAITSLQLDAFGINHGHQGNGFFGGFKMTPNDRRRESSISTDSGFMMSLPESRRDSEVGSNQRRDSDFLTSFELNQQQKVRIPNGARRHDD